MYPKSVLGEAVMAKTDGVFPLLFKLIDANDKLSVQVHPDDAYAKAVESEPNGKHEAWYILEAAQNAEIVYGLLPGTTSEQLRQKISDSRVSDCLKTVRVKQGDVIDIAPGTIHAIGEGIVLAEIQQNSNLTYRVYDYDRQDSRGERRELHIAKALDVIDYAPPNPFPKGTVVYDSEGATATSMVSNKFFHLDVLDIRRAFELNTEGDRFHILFVVRGDVQISYDSGELRVKMGETVLIPAALGKYLVTGKCCLLQMYVPTND